MISVGKIYSNLKVDGYSSKIPDELKIKNAPLS